MSCGCGCGNDRNDRDDNRVRNCQQKLREAERALRFIEKIADEALDDITSCDCQRRPGEEHHSNCGCNNTRGCGNRCGCNNTWGCNNTCGCSNRCGCSNHSWGR